MPKRRVKQIIWEVESERMALTPAMERRMKRVTLQRAKEELAEFAAAVTDEKAFYALPDAASAAYNLGQFEEAKQFAERSIALAQSFKGNWNYGNALHAGHTILGLLALRDGHVNQAIEELHASASAGGSPQLGSFGPTMQLAKELLKLGESESVLTYFELCRSFWKGGNLWLSIWEKKVKRGAMPNFFMNLYR